MEHKLLLGGEEYLPFARSRIKALRAAGLSYGSQKLEIDDASIKVRIDGQHDYIKIEADPGGNFVIAMRAHVTGEAVHNEQYEHHVFITQAQNFAKLKVLRKLAAYYTSSTLVFNGAPYETDDNILEYEFLGAFNKKLVYREKRYIQTGPAEAWPGHIWKSQNTESQKTFVGSNLIAERQMSKVDDRVMTQGGNGSWAPVGLIVSRTSGAFMSGLSWDAALGESTTQIQTRTYPAYTNGAFPPNTSETTVSEASHKVAISADVLNKVSAARRSTISAVPTSSADSYVFASETINRHAVDFLQVRNAYFRNYPVLGVCKEGFYYCRYVNNAIEELFYTRYSSGFDVFLVPTLDTAGLLPVGVSILTVATRSNIRFFDDFFIVKIYEGGKTSDVSKRAVMYASFSRVTGKPLWAKAYSVVPFEQSGHPVLSSADTVYKPIKLPGFEPGTGGFSTTAMLRDELACM